MLSGKASSTRRFSDEELLEKFEAEGFDRILKGEITSKICFTSSYDDFDTHWSSSMIKGFVSLFPNSIYRKIGGSESSTTQLVKFAKDRACTTLFFFHSGHVKLGVLVRIVSLLKGSSVRFMLKSIQMFAAPRKNPLRDYIMKMLQPLFPINTHYQLAWFPNDSYLIGGGRDGTRFLLKFWQVQMGTFDTITGEFSFPCLPQGLGFDTTT